MESTAASLKRKRAEEAASNTYSPSSKATTKYHELNLAQKLLVINDSEHNVQSNIWRGQFRCCKQLERKNIRDKFRI